MKMDDHHHQTHIRKHHPKMSHRCSCSESSFQATSLANPEDVPSALPPGKVKFLAFFLVFLLWAACRRCAKKTWPLMGNMMIDKPIIGMGFGWIFGHPSFKL